MQCQHVLARPSRTVHVFTRKFLNKGTLPGLPPPAPSPSPPPPTRQTQHMICPHTHLLSCSFALAALALAASALAVRDASVLSSTLPRCPTDSWNCRSWSGSRGWGRGWGRGRVGCSWVTAKPGCCGCRVRWGWRRRDARHSTCVCVSLECRYGGRRQGPRARGRGPRGRGPRAGGTGAERTATSFRPKADPTSPPPRPPPPACPLGPLLCIERSTRQAPSRRPLPPAPSPACPLRCA